MNFKNSLINLRNQYNLTQMEFAKRIGVSTGVLAEWESGESEPDLEQLAKISSEFNISLDTLINSSDKCQDSVSIPQNTPSLNISKSKSAIVSDRSSSIFIKRKKILVTIILLIIVLVVLGFFAFTFLENKPLYFFDDSKAILKAESSVVKVYCYDHNGIETCTGSGFIAFNGQTVVTNYHVACEGYTIKVSTDQDISYDVDSIIAYSEEKDISILKLTDDTGLEPLCFGNSDVIEKGENVTVIGSPLGIKNSISKGILSGRIPAKDFDILQFTAPISSGSSGGALFNSDGEVIGVTYASYENGQNLNLAIPINIVSDLYNIKSIPTQTNLLYRRTYPYVDYLNNAVETTIDDLNNNQTENFKNFQICIIKSVYISSFNGDTLETSTKAYITDNKSSVSGSFSYDSSSKDTSLLFVSWDNDKSDYVDNSMVYCDKSIDAGSLVTVLLERVGPSFYDNNSYHNCKALINQNE